MAVPKRLHSLCQSNPPITSKSLEQTVIGIESAVGGAFFRRAGSPCTEAEAKRSSLQGGGVKLEVRRKRNPCAVGIQKGLLRAAAFTL